MAEREGPKSVIGPDSIGKLERLEMSTRNEMQAVREEQEFAALAGDVELLDVLTAQMLQLDGRLAAVRLLKMRLAEGRTL